MSEEQSIDLANMKKERAKVHADAFSHMSFLDGLRPEELKTYGYKSRDEAVADAFRRRMAQVRALEAAYLKKWPD